MVPTRRALCWALAKGGQGVVPRPENILVGGMEPGSRAVRGSQMPVAGELF